MRLPRLHVLRALVTLAIALASPGIEVSHGLAHHHDHHDARSPAHHAGASVESDDHSTDHGHPEISDALRIRADVLAFISVEAPGTAVDFTQTPAAVAVPVSDSRLFVDRATGPPPRLRAPPID